MADSEIKGSMNHTKEDEHMQNNQDPKAVKSGEKPLEQAADKPEQKAAGPHKKKNIIQVFRPQNSKTGMVKPGGRPRPQGSRQAAPGARTAGGGRAQGITGSGARPQGEAAARPRTAGGSAPAARTQGIAGSRPQGNADQQNPVRPQAASGTSSAVKQQGNTGTPANINLHGASGISTETKPQNPTRAVGSSAGADTSVSSQNMGANADTKAASIRANGNSQTVHSSSAQNTAEAVKTDKIQGTNRQGQSGSRQSSDRRTQEGRQNQGSYGRGSDGRYSQGTNGKTSDGSRSSQSRSFDGSRSGQGRSSDGRSGQNKSYDGSRSSDRKTGAQGSYSRNSDGRSGQNSYTRSGGDRKTGTQGSYSRNSDGRSGQGSYGRGSDGSRGNQGSYGRSSDGRSGQNSRGMGIPKSSGDTKPLEKESRKRTERGDRNRSNKGEKLDRMEKNVRPGQKNTQKNGQKTAQRKGQPVKPAPKPQEKPQDTIRTITLPEKMTISELAEAMKVTASVIVKKLFLQGEMVTVNQEVDFDKAEEIALEFNCICEKEEKVDVIGELLKEEEESEDVMIARPPVVCVMGHVDHGKTSLLDAIRHTHVIDKEAGGITQHIGAYVVSIDGRKITFLDTPGHEAFTAMRMRGANSTDIAILVVAADDGVMPQTIEAINHAKAAGIEIIVAINKIDKPSANIERVKQELSEYELIPEDWGGSTVMVPVSAHTHEGIDNLLEMILLTADVMELKANPNRKARGLVIEAELDKGKGPVATVLVQKGTLHVGDPIAAGACHGKIRAMMDDKGRRVKEAGPSTPVEVLGLSDVPNAGGIFISMDNEKEARSFAETFISEGRERMLEDTKMRMSLDDLYSQIQAGKLKQLDLIVKADVQGSVEAVKQSLLKLSNEEVVVKIIHSGVGAINESDVILASASNAIIIGFNIRPDAMAKATAERENVDVRLYRVIYDAIADVEAAMKGMLDPVYEEKVIGHAEIRQLFKASGVGTIAGSYVLDGVFQRGCKVRITRGDEQIYDGALASLKRFKDDVKEVKAGYECGFVFEKFNEIKEEDKVEAYVMVEVPR
ncbi:MAG: translation initiation factor IF-2 [Lachnospiraceae bacterium]|nr:translation initiation factor IF-2 [Lachnospiraceae bacterium]